MMDLKHVIVLIILMGFGGIGHASRIIPSSDSKASGVVEEPGKKLSICGDHYDQILRESMNKPSGRNFAERWFIYTFDLRCDSRWFSWLLTAACPPSTSMAANKFIYTSDGTTLTNQQPSSIGGSSARGICSS